MGEEEPSVKAKPSGKKKDTSAFQALEDSDEDTEEDSEEESIQQKKPKKKDTSAFLALDDSEEDEEEDEDEGGNPLASCVVAEVVEVSDHPKDKSAKVLKVDVEQGGLTNAVAHFDVMEGAKYVFAPVGLTLPDGAAVPAKVKGFEMEGML